MAASSYNTRSSTKKADVSRSSGLPERQTFADIYSNDSLIDACLDRPVPGAKRTSSNFLPPLPPSSSVKKRLARQRSDSCMSGISMSGVSSASGVGVGTFPGISSTVLTPTSKACMELTCGIDLFPPPSPREQQSASLECSMTDVHTRCSGNPGRSPSSTDITFQSSNCRNESNGAVKCEEELDYEEDEVRGGAQSEASCHVSEGQPRWNQAMDVISSPPSHCPSHDLLGSPPAARIADSIAPEHSPAAEQCGPYELDIFHNLRQDEMSRKPAWGYLETTQRDLIVEHRRIMINWLVEVLSQYTMLFAEEFSLESDTLFLCVAILDQFLLCGPPVKKGSLQLLGTACMLIAVKFQESHPPNMIQSCCIASEGSFTEKQVIAMEALVLKTIGYCCAIPTTQTFLWHHLKEVHSDNSLEKLSEYLAMLSLTDYALLKYYPSALSAASVLLAGLMMGKEPVRHLTNMRCEYSFGDLKPIMRVLLDLHQKAPADAHLSSIRRKFMREQHCTIAALKSPTLGSLAERRC